VVALITAIRAVSHDWDGTLAECPAWSPKDGDLLVVAAHPDDEVRGAGGLIHAWVARGATVRVLSVSDGETLDPRCCALASARREELNDALRKLCPKHVAVTRLGLPLGKISRHHNRLRNALLSLASGQVTLVAPNERAVHPDHEAVGRVCTEFARAQGIALARYGIGQYGIAPGQSASDNTVRESAARESAARWVKFVLTDDATRAKARALQCFRARSASRRGRSASPVETPQQAADWAYEAFLV
jgi:LmbE family N-acetylglucosaminyl deacetylase